jgi:uncharacterized protein YndB with AHSA1/START domain
MREITVTREIAAPRSAVWAVLADFPNIADWNGGVKKSYSTGQSDGGVGATRHCDLAPIGELEETITAWEPDRRMVVSIDSAAKLPIKSAEVTFTLAAADDSTPIELGYAYQPKFGPIGSLLGPMMDRQLTSGFEGFLADLDRAATGSASSPDRTEGN